MAGSTLRDAHQHLADALQALAAATSTATDDELLSVLPLCEGATRQLDQIAVTAVAGLDRRGVFAERGYRSTTSAVADLLGCERFDARRRVTVAEYVTERVRLDGAASPPRLPATAAVFAAGQAGLRHVEAIARVLGTDSAARLDPDSWAGAETQLADKAGDYTPAELATWGTALPQLTVIIGLDDLEHRARAAVLDFGGTLTRRRCACWRVMPSWSPPS